MSNPHVLIIGAGLAGPALALALARNSIQSTIYERRPSKQCIGGVISLAPNAVHVLDKIVGVEPEIRKLGYTFHGFELQSSSLNGQMDQLGAFGFDDTLGVAGITLKRPDFHAKLLDICQEKGVKVHYDKALKSIEERDDGVTAIFEDGTRAEGDIILGTDGIYSKVRQHVLGGSEKAAKYPAEYTGHVVLGSITQRSHIDFGPNFAPPSFILTQAGSILVFPTDPSGDTLQWAAFLTSPERDRESWERYRQSGEAIKDFHKEWSSIKSGPVRTLLDSLTPENLLLWAPYATPDLPTWHTKRVCILGDAAHAISPSAGQGTAQALEDVGLLVRLLSSPTAMSKGYSAIFAHYEKARRKRIEVIKQMVERTLQSRAPIPSWTKFWLKTTLYKLAFGALSGLQRFLPAGRNPTNYDVTKESIEV